MEMYSREQRRAEGEPGTQWDRQRNGRSARGTGEQGKGETVVGGGRRWKKAGGRERGEGVEDIIRVEKPTPPCHQEIMPDSSN